MDIDRLNDRFAVAGHLRFVTGPGDLPLVVIANGHASARISIYGGQVLGYHPARQEHDLLFLSGHASYQPGKAIRGGVPVCWPWFGPDPEDHGRPAHGLARTRHWRVLDAAPCTDGSTRVSLGLEHDADSLDLWPHAFALSLHITVGETLALELVTANPGPAPFTVSQALHSYFAVGDVGRTRVVGLDGCAYLDKVGGTSAVQHGDLTIAGELDRVYQAPPAELVIADAAWGRRIEISAGGSRSAVVWNPGAQVAARMADLGDEDYRHMLCVETANAGHDLVTVPAGGEHRLAAGIRVTAL